MIAALQVSLDGFTQGSDLGGPEWVDSWADALGLIPDVDAFVQGGGMYPGYGEFWKAIEKDPNAIAPYSTRKPYGREVEYAQFAAKTPHYVVSRTLEGVSWPPSAKMVRDVGELRAIKAQPGKNIYVVGGATLVTLLMNEDLLDELHLIVHPILLGGGRALFAGVTKPRVLEPLQTRSVNGRTIVSYRL